MKKAFLFLLFFCLSAFGQELDKRKDFKFLPLSSHYDLRDLAQGNPKLLNLKENYENAKFKETLIANLHVAYLGLMLLNVVPNSFSSDNLVTGLVGHGAVIGATYYFRHRANENLEEFKQAYKSGGARITYSWNF